MKSSDCAYIGIFAGLICVSAWICVPSSPPFTLQTFAVAVASVILGDKRAVAAVLVYLMLGLFGLPVFSGMTAGAGTLFGPTGGYLFGFIPFCMISGCLAKKCRGMISLTLSLFAGLVACYSIGTMYFSFFTGNDIRSAIFLCVLPFILPDSVKMVAATFCIRYLKKHISVLQFI